MYALHDKDEFAAFRPEAEPADYCSREGAAVLKAKIEAYWAARGQHVTVLLHNVGFHPAIRAARFDVRSDMINGMPRTGAGKPAAPTEEVFIDDFDEGDLIID
ncbi:MAG: hypothetical protein JNK94_02815 [Hyphomonadaceae bacterium]|nr:hypothetical protein [Hyphomonadaceae bacterium]MBX3511545.1 hypothetical protein [Hyphomonadaceae bacterium]